MLVEANIEGDIRLNWESLPDKVKAHSNFEKIKEKVFTILQSEYPPDTPFDSKVLFQINRRAFQIIKENI